MVSDRRGLAEVPRPFTTEWSWHLLIWAAPKQWSPNSSILDYTPLLHRWATMFYPWFLKRRIMIIQFTWRRRFHYGALRIYSPGETVQGGPRPPPFGKSTSLSCKPNQFNIRPRLEQLPKGTNFFKVPKKQATKHFATFRAAPKRDKSFKKYIDTKKRDEALSQKNKGSKCHPARHSLSCWGHYWRRAGCLINS